MTNNTRFTKENVRSFECHSLKSGRIPVTVYLHGETAPRSISIDKHHFSEISSDNELMLEQIANALNAIEGIKKAFELN